MGICGNKEQSQAPQQRQSQRVNQVSDVNDQYNSVFILINNQSSGSGLKRTKAYVSTIPEGKLYKMRNEFWETRVEGKEEIWGILKNAIDLDEETALMMLQVGEIQLIGHTIEHCYDRQGGQYDIPVFCINDPIKYIEEKKEIVNMTKTNDIKLTINVRCSRFNGQDLQIQIDNNKYVNELKQMIIKAKYDELFCEQVRLFYFGKELKESMQLLHYGIQDKTVLIAYCF